MQAGLRKKREAAAANKEKVSFGGNSVGPDWGVRFANLETPGHYDMHARLRDLDNDGVAAEVMFHDSQNGEPIPFQVDTLLMRGTGQDQDFDLLRAGQHIYNQWLADVCSIQPERHIGLMHLPMWDMEAALEELHWARSVGLKGAEFPVPEALHAALQRSRRGTRSSRPVRTWASPCATTEGLAPAAAHTREPCRSPSTSCR